VGKPYEARFEQGTRVRIRSRPELERFRSDWIYHNPLTDEHLKHAGATATVAEVGYYHGGDVLYQLDGIPGVWHEANLSPA
jgi:hypothetical protein